MASGINENWAPSGCSNRGMLSLQSRDAGYALSASANQASVSTSSSAGSAGSGTAAAGAKARIWCFGRGGI